MNSGARNRSRKEWASRSGAFSRPHSGLAAAQSGDQVVDHVGGEGTGEAGFEVALGAVVEHRPGGGDLGGGVGQVVGQHLVLVGSTGRRRWRIALPTTLSASSMASAAPTRSLAGSPRAGRHVVLASIRGYRDAVETGKRLVTASDANVAGWRMRSEPTTRICVYCGSNAGTSPAFGEAAHQLGSALAHRGIGLVYGGGHVGLMGLVADAALAADGEVIGVITEQLVRAEVAHDGLSRLEVVPTMHDRKARLTELADGFVVLPGGFGTVDEFAEALTWNQLGLIAKPVVLLDVEGYWGPLVRLDVQLGQGRFRARLASHAGATGAHRRRGDRAGHRAGSRRRTQVDRPRRHAAAWRTSFTVQLITSAAPSIIVVVTSPCPL